MMQNIDKFAACQTRLILTNTRSSRPYMLHEIGVLKNLTKFTEKHLYWRSTFFNWPATLRKKRLRRNNFPLNFAKYFKEHSFYRTLSDDCFWVSQYIPRAFKTKCEKNKSNDILITYLYILMANSLNLHVNEHTSIHQTAACKNKANPYKFISNDKQRSREKLVIEYFICKLNFEISLLTPKRSKIE